MTGRRPFDPDDLGLDRPDELDDARSAAAWLEASIDDAPVQPRAGFGDRVMAALAGEPSPSPVGFLAPIRRLGFIGGFGASVRQAWTATFGGGRPVFARASALAYVLAVVLAGTSLAGVATVGLAGALGVLGPSPTQSAPPATPGPTSAPETTTRPSPESAPPTPAESEEPSETPDASDDNGGSSEADASDDHGSDGSSSEGSSSDDDSASNSPTFGSDGSGSGSDDEWSSGSGSDSESSTPRPSETPRPTGTPQPTETPD